MQANEYRKQTSEQLNNELVELRKEQFNLRMQRGSGQLSNPARFTQLRKEIARIKTILKELGQS